MLASPRLATHLGRLGVAMKTRDPNTPTDQTATARKIDVAANVSAMPFLLQPIWEVFTQDMRRTPFAPPSP